MHQNTNVDIPDDIRNEVYSVFTSLSLRDRLVIYSKLVHGNSFKIRNNDIMGLNKRIVSRIYRSFLDKTRENLNVTKKNKKK